MSMEKIITFLFILLLCGCNTPPNCPPLAPPTISPKQEDSLLNASYRKGWIDCYNHYSRMIDASGGVDNPERINKEMEKQFIEDMGNFRKSK